MRTKSHQKTAERELRGLIDTMGLPYLRISTSPHCNADCIFCHNEGQLRGKRGADTRPEPSFLTLEDYEYIAQFFASQFGNAKFTGGEPTLTENLPEIVSVFRKAGYTCSMTTNGHLLDAGLQAKLKNAGICRINVSLPSLDAAEYSGLFGVGTDCLSRVIRNVEELGHVYGSSAKLNFMALKGRNVPSQLVPITKLSAETGLTVSCMEVINPKSLERPISSSVIEYLNEKIGISSWVHHPDTFSHKSIITFKNGGTWEIDDFRRSSYRHSAFANEYCQGCPVRDMCVEGPYALRVLFDGTVKPCLIRGDNTVALGVRGYELEA